MEPAALICEYAERFAALGTDQHQVGSPLGAWLALALAATAAQGALREEISHALGTDVESAQRLVAELLDSPHPAVAMALAAWAMPGLPGLDPWRSTLPARVTTGAVPTREQADAWAREQTLGMIDTFPIDVRDTVIVLASALATRVTWLHEFDVVDSAQLRGPWSEELNQVLHSPRHGDAPTGHDCFIVATQRAGNVAVHSALADDDLEVTSVIAGAQVPRADVLAVAHQIATARATSGVPPLSLFDLPLGDTALWTITEHQAAAGGEHAEAILPAWHAGSRHDLLDVPALAFGAAGQALCRSAGIPGQVRAAQSAVATYSRRGFEAAAVTGLAIALSYRAPPPPGPYRTATLRFAHPYAVVAATRAPHSDPWCGVPVFAAWITRPDDATADN
ncbi:MAG: hypothetical protein QOK11_3293 [Pseudonocardiales bacterium]|nr:hypothetical protein [Pseudonocardiales bacterium]